MAERSRRDHSYAIALMLGRIDTTGVQGTNHSKYMILRAENVFLDYLDTTYFLHLFT